MRSPGGSSYQKVVLKSSHGAKMDGVPDVTPTKVTPRKTAAINEGVKMPTTGASNPMSSIKDKSNYGKGGQNGGAIC